MSFNKKFFTTGGIVASTPSAEGVVNTDNFAPFLYTGDNTTSRSLTGVGFDPDMIWVKNRDSDGENHVLADTVRGGGSIVFPNLTLAEITSTYITPATDGFNITTNNNNILDFDYVAWCFKAGGAAVSNTNGSIASQVSANQAAGFSIVSFTSNGAASVVSTGHGLSVEPEMVIFKNRDNSSYWLTYHKDIGDNGYLALQDTFETQPFTPFFDMTSTTIAVRQSSLASNNEKCIAYCFHSVDGYQKVGSYTGTSPTSQTIYTTDDGTATGSGGFQPRFVMWKATNNVENWYMMDSVRGVNNVLYADGNFAEGTSLGVSFTSTGFTLSGSFNASGINYIYLAIA